jgi:signal transduction histidine kinase
MAPLADEAIRSLIASHELERRRIARDLHDVVGQALTAVRLHLELIRTDQATTEAIAQETAEALRLVDATLHQVRDLATDIRPSILDDLGLVAAARSWVARVARLAGFVAEFQGDVPPNRDLDPEIATACFRSLQEALTNVVRHARASIVEVRLDVRGDELVLTVRDDGVGFDPTPFTGRRPRSSLGLIGLWERIALVSGRLTIDSTPGRGTVLRAAFPFPRTDQPALDAAG